MSGFTIMELIIVIVIIGILAAVALPSYRIQVLKIKSQEGVRVLMALFDAQKDYQRENGFYAADIDDLDIEIPPLKNFQDPDIWGGAGSPHDCGGATPNAVAAMSDKANSYRLAVLTDGKILCKTSILTCATNDLCQKMGYATTGD